MLFNNIKILTNKDMFLYIEYTNKTYGEKLMETDILIASEELNKIIK